MVGQSVTYVGLDSEGRPYTGSEGSDRRRQSVRGGKRENGGRFVKRPYAYDWYAFTEMRRRDEGIAPYARRTERRRTGDREGRPYTRGGGGAGARQLGREQGRRPYTRGGGRWRKERSGSQSCVVPYTRGGRGERRSGEGAVPYAEERRDARGGRGGRRATARHAPVRKNKKPH